MNGSETIRERFSKLRDFLSVFQNIYGKSLIRDLNENLSCYPGDWLDELSNRSLGDLWKMLVNGNHEGISNKDLKIFLGEIRELSSLPSYEQSKNFAAAKIHKKNFYDYLTPKKRHEIEKLTSFIESKHQEYQFSRIIDVGGGMGHLARMMAASKSLAETDLVSIDRDSCLQQRGKDILRRNFRQNQKLEFLELSLSEKANEKDEKLRELLKRNVLSVGLHTCGCLSISHIRYCLDCGEGSLINIGCCYHKLDPENEIHLSKDAKRFPLIINQFALELMVRKNHKRDPKQFDAEWRVQSYRFALHLFLEKYLGLSEFRSAGFAPRRTYRQSFEAYAKDRLKTMNVDDSKFRNQFQIFFDDLKTQEFLKKIFAAQAIRWQLARPLEIYLLFDRALFMQEHGWEIEVFQIFDDHISPRNIAIWGKKNATSL